MRRLVGIGLDAADPILLDRLVSRGLMPSLAQLSSTAVRTSVRNAPGLFAGSVWPTFATGLTPARHGRYCWRQLRGRTYDDEFFQPNQLTGVRFWDRLDAAGLQVAVIDVPKASVADRFRGTFVKDWGTHDPSAGGVQVRGSLTKPGVLSQYGCDPIGICDHITRTPDGYRRFTAALLQRIRTRTQMLLDLIATRRFDLLICSFSEAHCVGHQCWHIHDPIHADHDPELASATGDPVSDVYCALDAALGHILANIADRDRFIVFATHGMGRHYNAVDMLPEIVAAATARVAGRTTGSMPMSAPPLLAMDSREFRRSVEAFAIPNNGAFAAVRVNVIGREPAGLIGPAELDSFAGRLRTELMGFRNGVTGEGVFLEGLLTSSVFPRSEGDSLPDLVLRWNRNSPIESVVSTVGERFSRPHSGVRTGDHTADGCAWFSRRTDRTGRSADAMAMEDFAPTICRVFGIGPGDVDGTARMDLIEAE